MGEEKNIRAGKIDIGRNTLAYPQGGESKRDTD
jgi:hypothetical protein